MPSVRLMTSADVDAVAQLDILAFAEYGRQAGLDGLQFPRTPENILACLNLNPQGCFVAGTDEPVGYIFSRVWGAIGWLGTFGLHPDYQGQGLGRALLRAGVEYLQSAGCTTIGLETMPDSPYNVGFYTRFGFRPTFPSLRLFKEVEQLFKVSSFALFSQQRNEVLPTLTQISQAAWPGLDYAPEAYNAKEYGWGETLLIGWPKTWAFAIVRTIPKREGSNEPVAEVITLVIHPQARWRLAEALQAVEAFAVSQNAQQIDLSVNAVDGQTLQSVLEYGFRVNRVMLRMVYAESEYACPHGVDLSRWVM